MPAPVDCLVVGAGPAGLTAAIYLARFRLNIAVIDAGASRAATIPRTHNHAGFPGGISGEGLLARMRQQAEEFGVKIRAGAVDRLDRQDGTFAATVNGTVILADTVLLATGVVNHHPNMDDTEHDLAVQRGLLRYCPICDGYEVTDKRIAVIGSGTHGHDEALFLRMYATDVTLIAPDAALALTPDERSSLIGNGVKLVDGPCGRLRISHDRIIVATTDEELAFESIYPALGSMIRSELAVGLGAAATDDGCLTVDDHQRTTIEGLYAAGDVTKGLDQISHAMGQAAVAATTIRNDLAKTRPLLRT